MCAPVVPSTHELHVLDQTYPQPMTGLTSSLSAWGMGLSNPPASPLLSVDLVSLSPEADIFSFLQASWPPSWPCPGPLAEAQEAQCYLLLRELCVQRVNTVWLVEQGSNLLLARTKILIYGRVQTHTQSHMTTPGVWQRCFLHYNHYTQSNWETWETKQKTHIRNPGNYNSIVASNSYSRTWNTKLWMWWRDRENTMKAGGKFTLTGCDSIHSGELYGLLDSLGNMSSGGLSSARTLWDQVV